MLETRDQLGPQGTSGHPGVLGDVEDTQVSALYRIQFSLTSTNLIMGRHSYYSIILLVVQLCMY